jgi:hypothetical protein
VQPRQVLLAQSGAQPLEPVGQLPVGPRLLGEQPVRRVDALLRERLDERRPVDAIEKVVARDVVGREGAVGQASGR